ncbi:MAG: ATP-binding cassette domain-containing protein [Ruminococcus sp.]|nr:ATP-binding cassette domain-containing protein [Ruminococcus sp.]MBP3797588.1 ATP-binding cassette domain-containing protein [Ruminococcus sp.]
MTALARFWDIENGEILLRGTDIRKLPLSVLMDNISMVFQRVYLFRDTVYNNIALGRPDVTKDEVIETAKKARCYDFIMELTDGFDTVIGEGGASLSGGQAQRLSIARCILNRLEKLDKIMRDHSINEWSLLHSYFSSTMVTPSSPSP